jgi:hypothetical protein
MKKAYDVKELVERLKGKGVVLAEEAVVQMLDATLDWFKESAALSENPYDDMLVGLIPTVKRELLKQIDKIDGEQNRS